MNVSSELETNVLSNITKEMETMRNETKELLSVNSDVSEELQNLTVAVLKTNSRLGQGYECGGTFGWRRVVYLDMTKPNASCPSGWQLTSYDSKNLCGKVDTGSLTCDSVIFPVTGGDYTSVCGSIIAYQKDQIDAFEPYNDGRATTIDSAYVSGVSLTHGYTSGHLQLVLLRIDQPGKMPVLVMLVLVSESHHLWVETISVSQGLTRDSLHQAHHIQMTLSGMAVDVLPAVAVAHSTILHTLLSNFPTLHLIILRPDCVDGILVMTLQ